MPIIEFYEEVDEYGANCQAAFEGQSELIAAPTFTLGAHSSFNGKTVITAHFEAILPVVNIVNFNGQSTLTGFAHLDGDPSIFPSVECDIDSLIEFLPTHKQIPFLNCQFTVNLIPNPLNSRNETYPLEIIVDIIPPSDTGTQQEYVYELMINGTTVVPIKSFTYSEAKADVGNSLQIELADVTFIPALEAASSFRFRIGKVVDGVTTWKTYIDEGILDGSNYSLSRQGNAPLTTFNFTNKSAVESKLARCPKRDLVIYDPQSVAVRQEDFEILNDVEGVEIITEVVGVNGLTLHGLFQQIFIGRCDFTQIVTNLPNYPVKRADFTMTESYLSEIAGLIGMFEPLIFEYDGKVWIIDTTMTLPPGFPVSKEITVSTATAMRVTKQPQRIDAYLVVYAEDARAFDFYTTRTETTFEENGSAALGNYTKTEITRTINDYRTFANPSVVIKSEVVRDRRETSNYQGQTVGRTLEEYTYDYYGRQTVSTKTQSAYLPQLTGGLRAITDIHQERVEIRYAADPFQPSRQIQQQIWTDIKGLIAVDDENKQLDEPFKQDYMVAYQSGNLNDGMTTQFGLIKTIRETTYPLSKGQFQLETVTHDYLLQTVTRETTEPKNGDFSMSALVSKQRRVLLPFQFGSVDGVNAVIKKLYLGELPITYGLALATRLLARANAGQTSASTDFIGVDFYLRRGLPVSLKNLEDDILVNCLIEGYSITGNYKSLMTTIDGLKIG